MLVGIDKPTESKVRLVGPYSLKMEQANHHHPLTKSKMKYWSNGVNMVLHHKRCSYGYCDIIDVIIIMVNYPN